MDWHRLAGWMLAALVLSCSGDLDVGDDGEPAHRGTGGAASTWPGSGSIGGSVPGPGDFYLVYAEEFTQDTGSGELNLADAGFVNPYAPTNWVSPIACQDGEIGMHVEVLSRSNPDATVEYQIGWTQGSDPDRVEWLWILAQLPSETGTVGFTRRVRLLELDSPHVEPGTPVGDNWDWEHAFGRISGNLRASQDGVDVPLSATLQVKLLVFAP